MGPRPSLVRYNSREHFSSYPFKCILFAVRGWVRGQAQDDVVGARHGQEAIRILNLKPAR
eukprot:821121-Amphidinium_carterae.1